MAGKKRKDLFKKLAYSPELETFEALMYRHGLPEKRGLVEGLGLDALKILWQKELPPLVLKNSSYSVLSPEMLVWYFAAYSSPELRHLEDPTRELTCSLSSLFFDIVASVLSAETAEDHSSPAYFNSQWHLLKLNIHCAERFCNLMLAWEAEGRHVYSLSSGLARMLRHTKLDSFPLERVRLPFEVLALELPNDVSFGYPLAPPKGVTDIEMIPITSLVLFRSATALRVSLLTQFDCGTSQYPCSFSNTIVDTTPLKTVSDLIGKVLSYCHKDCSSCNECGNPEGMSKYYSIRRKVDESILRYVVSASVYASSVDADVVLSNDSEVYKNWADSLRNSRVTKKERKLMSRINLDRAPRATKHSLGSSVTVVDRHYTLTEERNKSGVFRKSPRTHWRAGHFKIVWSGPMEGERKAEVMYIQPIIVAPVKNQLETAPTRKTRMQ